MTRTKTLVEEKEQAMSGRAYILLHIVEGKSKQVARALREKPGVVMVDSLEGPPDVIVVVEASEKQELAKLTIQALGSVEAMTENVCLLPANVDLA